MPRLSFLSYRWIIALFFLISLFLVSADFVNQNGYEIVWSMTSAGGDFSEGGSYSLFSAIGGAEAGAILTGGDYQLVSGALDGSLSGPSGRYLYLPVILR